MTLKSTMPCLVPHVTTRISNDTRVGTSRSRLLELPRELRDNVYGYLAHDLDFVWWFKSTPGGILLPHFNLNVKAQGVPNFAALLVNFQMYEEYRDICSKECVSLVAKFPIFWHDSKPSETAAARERKERILAKAHSITIIKGSNFEPEFVLYGHVVNTLALIAPNLSTVKIAAVRLCDGLIDDAQILEESEPFPASSRTHFLLSPPDSIGKFKLVQRGEGYRVSLPLYLCKTVYLHTKLVLRSISDFMFGTVQVLFI
ncbi:hypothetical protein BKA66DRAFT_475474 [Pyrenochaeta sp. MPI-SDFR-AT-0127]|nr:hypothetical protein BKA66DRAFT_475474 [Pyrenochaeta sp. MPI-SDFR-AT-0127]